MELNDMAVNSVEPDSMDPNLRQTKFYRTQFYGEPDRPLRPPPPQRSGGLRLCSQCVCVRACTLPVCVCVCPQVVEEGWTATA